MQYLKLSSVASAALRANTYAEDGHPFLLNKISNAYPG